MRSLTQTGDIVDRFGPGGTPVPWKETCRMEERLKMIPEMEKGEKPMAMIAVSARASFRSHANPECQRSRRLNCPKMSSVADQAG
jgi:hypothetical protein